MGAVCGRDIVLGAWLGARAEKEWIDVAMTLCYVVLHERR